MRKVILLGAILFAATAVVAGDLQPLDVKTGVWQVTTTRTFQGMGAPETQTYKSCITEQTRDKYPFPDRDNSCVYKVESSTSTHMAVGGDCQSQGGTANFKIQLDVVDSENVRGSGELTIASPQGTIHGTYSGKGKWLAASCPAGMK